MMEEMQLDVEKQSLYMGKRLTALGRTDYPALLRMALERGNDVSLAAELRAGGRLATEEPRSKPTGGTTMVKVPVNAPEILAEGEFNRFYIRAMCRRAIEDNIPQLAVYRAKRVAQPRPDSEAKIGSKVDPKKLLADLRANVGVDTALGLPAGPNSGLSVRLP